MEFEEAIQYLAVKPGLRPAADGSCAFELQGIAVTLQLIDQQRIMLVRARLGPIALDDPGCMARMLAANLFTDLVGGSSLGMDEAGAAVLSQRLACSMQAVPSWSASLDRFVAHARAWQQRLSPAGVAP